MPANSATATGLAKRYATALFELARERNALDAVAKDLAELSLALDESSDLRRLVASPIVSRTDQGQAVTVLAERLGLGDLVRNVLGILAQNRRLPAIRSVIEGFNAMLAEARGEVQAELISAVELDEAQLAAVQAGVRRFAGKEVSLTSSVDPALLGGLVVRVGSRMVDASLRTKLQHLELAMRGIA